MAGRMKESTRVVVALAAGLAGGAAIAASGSARLVHVADAIAPIGTLWVNAIRMTVIPLVVSLLITGIASAADLRAIGRIGTRTLLVFVALLGGVALLVVPLAPSLFAALPFESGGRPPLPAGAAEAARGLGAAGGAPGFGAWLTSLMPTNPVAAAANDAMLPLIVFTVLLALAIARSPGAARDTLIGFFEALRETMLVLVRWIIAAAPVGVFALLLPLAAHGGAALAGSVGLFVLVYSVACIALVLLLLPVGAIGGRIPLRRFARALLPPQLIAFSSSSSIASLPVMIEAADEELGLPTRVSGFVLPLAVSTFHVAAPVSWTLGALFVAWFYAVPLHFAQFAIVAFAAVFLAFVAPGVPRGAFLMLAPLFAAVGLPIEGIGILIAVDAIPDLFGTVLNVTGDMVAVALAARFQPEDDALPAHAPPRKAAVGG